jgi:glutaredoxin
MTNEKTVLVFSTPSCTNCKPLKESLIRLGVGFTEVNCYEPENFELMQQHDVRGVPTTIIIDGGEVKRVAGNKPQEVLELYQ